MEGAPAQPAVKTPLSTGPRFEDRIVFETGMVRIGAFRCDRQHPTFTNTGPAENYCFVFPRTSVVIEHEHERPFVANPTIATFYNRRQHYCRRPISEDGDRSDWFGVHPAVLSEIVEACSPERAIDERRLFPWTHAPVDSHTYLLQRRVFEQAAARALVEPLPIEEAILLILERTVRHAAGGAGRGSTARTRPRQHELVHETQVLLSRRFDENLSLASIAAHVGTSEYHLCRLFRHATGTTLHGYRHRLRMRESLERIAGCRAGLTDVALGLGFSSHSHFTQAFRQEFGERPSRLRTTLRAAPAD